jgi:hypothetical protein
MRHGGTAYTNGDVIPFGEGGWRDDTGIVDRFIDLSKPQLFAGDRIRPLAVAASWGLGRLALAEVESRRGEHDVRLVDFDKAAIAPVARITDCDGGLEELTHESKKPSRWLVFACVKPYGGGRFGGTVQWSEIVDTQTRARYRTKSLVEGVIPSGIAIVSDRRDVAGETRHSATAISAVDLTHP